jgi:hypothetical protein
MLGGMEMIALVQVIGQGAYTSKTNIILLKFTNNKLL